MWKLKKLYEVIKEQRMFEGFEECESCHILCSRDQSIHWLMAEEAERLKDKMRISKINDAYFFEGGQCPILKEKRCSAYAERPLECRLNPISLYEVDGKLYWILYLECPVVKKRQRKELVEKLKTGIRNISPLITAELKEEFKKTSKAIKNFKPLIEEDDFVRIMKV